MLVTHVQCAQDTKCHIDNRLIRHREVVRYRNRNVGVGDYIHNSSSGNGRPQNVRLVRSRREPKPFAIVRHKGVLVKRRTIAKRSRNLYGHARSSHIQIGNVQRKRNVRTIVCDVLRRSRRRIARTHVVTRGMEKEDVGKPRKAYHGQRGAKHSRNHYGNAPCVGRSAYRVTGKPILYARGLVRRVIVVVVHSKAPAVPLCITLYYAKKASPSHQDYKKSYV